MRPAVFDAAARFLRLAVESGRCRRQRDDVVRDAGSPGSRHRMPPSGSIGPGPNCRRPTQPKRLIVRHMRVIADLTLHTRHLVALEILLRGVEIALVAALLFWILPAIADAAG